MGDIRGEFDGVRLGFDAGALAQAEARDKERAARRGECPLIGRSGRMTMQVDTDAFMNAVNTEGLEVASAAGKGYWDDMKRRHPWIDCEGATRGARAREDGRVRTRFGWGTRVAVA